MCFESAQPKNRKLDCTYSDVFHIYIFLFLFLNDPKFIQTVEGIFTLEKITLYYNFGNEYLQGSLTKSFEAYDNVIFLQKDFCFFVCFSQVPRVTTLFHLCSKVCDFSGPPK